MFSITLGLISAFADPAPFSQNEALQLDEIKLDVFEEKEPVVKAEKTEDSYAADDELTNKEQSPSKKLIECINKVFEEYLGLNDDELALSIWKVASDCKTLLEMSERIRQSSELSQFEFPEDLIYDLWGIVDDYKKNRLGNANN
jgi:hypothetical protein